MADYRKLIPFILKFEGGYVNDPADSGGPTNKGVTLNTFRSVYGRAKTINDLKHMTDNEWRHIFKSLYWDKCKADDIANQSIANMLVDFAWHSGVTTAIKKLQKIVGVTSDGICGVQTIGTINSRYAPETFNLLKAARMRYLQGIVKNKHSQARFMYGWTKRVNAIEYGKLTY